MKQAVMVVDLGYGDAGKGTMTDYLTRQHSAHAVIRFNGGPQAGHNVVTEMGEHHTFSQFGSGTLAGVRTFLSRFMLVNPMSLIGEGNALYGLGISDIFDRITIDRNAPIITPFQIASNRLREMARGNGRHGSCGMGIGETMSDILTLGSSALYAQDLLNPPRLKEKLALLREYKHRQMKELVEGIELTDNMLRELEVFTDTNVLEVYVGAYTHFAEKVALVGNDYAGYLLDLPGTVIFEGSQGVLLDEWYGFHPYTTWSNMTLQNADLLLEEHSYAGETMRLGVLRAYATRHGAGPFVTEDNEMTKVGPDAHNITNPWQGAFRVGHFDVPAAQYALKVVGGVDALAITCIDQMYDFPSWDLCRAYRFASSGDDDGLLFELNSSGDAVGIKLNPTLTDLERQERLTSRLLECIPVYQPYSPIRGLWDEESYQLYLKVLEETLGTPVAIGSFGPTALDKRLITPLKRMERDLHLLQPI